MRILVDGEIHQINVGNLKSLTETTSKYVSIKMIGKNILFSADSYKDEVVKIQMFDKISGCPPKIVEYAFTTFLMGFQGQRQETFNFGFFTLKKYFWVTLYVYLLSLDKKVQHENLTRALGNKIVCVGSSDQKSCGPGGCKSGKTDLKFALIDINMFMSLTTNIKRNTVKWFTSSLMLLTEDFYGCNSLLMTKFIRN